MINTYDSYLRFLLYHEDRGNLPVCSTGGFGVLSLAGLLWMRVRQASLLTRFSKRTLAFPDFLRWVIPLQTSAMLGAQ